MDVPKPQGPLKSLFDFAIYAEAVGARLTFSKILRVGYCRRSFRP